MSGTANMPNPWMVGEFSSKLTGRQAAAFRLLFDDNMNVVASDAELQRFANTIDPALQSDFYALFPSAKPQQVDLTDSSITYDDLLDALLSGKLNGKDVDPEDVKAEIRRRNQEAGRSAAQPSTPAAQPLVQPRPRPSNQPAPTGTRRAFVVNAIQWLVSVVLGLIVVLNTIDLIDAALNHLHNAGHGWLTAGYFLAAWAIATLVSRIIVALAYVWGKAAIKYVNSLPQ